MITSIISYKFKKQTLAQGKIILFGRAIKKIEWRGRIKANQIVLYTTRRRLRKNMTEASPLDSGFKRQPGKA